MEEARSNCSFKTCDCEERDRMRTHIKGRQKGFYVYSSCGEMGDTVEGVSVMVVSCTGLQCPPDPLSTALCAPTPPAEASTCPLTEAPAGKRGWRDWGIHPPSPLPQAHRRLAGSSRRGGPQLLLHPGGGGLIPEDSPFPSSRSPGPEELALEDYPVLADFPKPAHLLVNGSWSLRGYLVQPVSYQNPNGYIQH